MKVAIIGCGTIGRELAIFIERETSYKLVALTDTNEKHATQLFNSLVKKTAAIVPLVESITAADLIIESAHPKAVQEILAYKELWDKEGKTLLVMSTGGLIGCIDQLYAIQNARILIPSGAIAGLDAIRAVQGKIDSLQLITTKPVASLRDAPYIKERKISLIGLKKKKKVFEGKLKEAVEAFPQNINVAATLFLASRFPHLHIIVYACPRTKINIHEIVCQGSFGTIRTRTENFPSSNPKTSQVAILSAKSLLIGAENCIKWT